MKKRKRFLCISLSIALMAATPAYADETLIPPPPIGNAQGAVPGGGGYGTGVPGTGVQGTGAPGTNAPGTNVPGKLSGSNGPGAGLGAQAPAFAPSLSNALKEPEILSEGAVLMDAGTGKLLYQKNADKRFYPASITKLMTALLVAEKCPNLDQVVTFSKTATTNLEAGSVTLDLTEGDKLTVRQCLYALLLKSANEVANALAEHVSGSISNFAGLMNAKAKALGCTNTHFANPSGLNDPDHYTTPRDMALIARAALNNPVVRKVDETLTYQIPATKKAKARTITMGHKMLNPADSRYYPGIIGGKTGYTSLAGNTLVTCVERDGIRLVAVVMKSKSSHYADTAALLDYGFKLAESNKSQPAGSRPSPQGWVSDGTRWHYVKENGKQAANQWLTIDGKDYWFDADSAMATGWRQFNNGAWYYFLPDGAMAKNRWEQNQTGAWFYLGGDGAMLTNATTPDGYRVDASGQMVSS